MLPDIQTQIEVLFDEIKARDAEIERLRAEVARLRAALKPFAWTTLKTPN